MGFDNDGPRTGRRSHTGPACNVHCGNKPPYAIRRFLQLSAFPVTAQKEVIFCLLFFGNFLQGYIPYNTISMVRHKKDNFSRGKKFSAPRHRPEPRGDDDNKATTGASRPPFKAACWDLGHCDPKRCSGKRLMQFGLMRELAIGHRYPGVVIS